MRKLIIIDINANNILLSNEDGVIFQIDRIKLPEDVLVRDKLFHIEHNRYDIYENGDDETMKYGLVPLTELRRVCD